MEQLQGRGNAPTVEVAIKWLKESSARRLVAVLTGEAR